MVFSQVCLSCSCERPDIWHLASVKTTYNVGVKRKKYMAELFLNKYRGASFVNSTDDEYN